MWRSCSSRVTSASEEDNDVALAWAKARDRVYQKLKELGGVVIGNVHEPYDSRFSRGIWRAAGDTA